jgi:hypothetical protein
VKLSLIVLDQVTPGPARPRSARPRLVLDPHVLDPPSPGRPRSRLGTPVFDLAQALPDSPVFDLAQALPDSVLPPSSGPQAPAPKLRPVLFLKLRPPAPQTAAGSFPQASAAGLRLPSLLSSIGIER